MVDREGRGSLRCCKPLSGIKKSQFFAETADHYARCSAVTRGLKEKCAAKPEEHRGNALFALPEPLAYNPLQDPLRRTQKVQRMTRSQSERLTRWEGAVNERSDVCGHGEELQPRLPSGDKLPNTPIASPGGRLLLKMYSTHFLFAAARH